VRRRLASAVVVAAVAAVAVAAIVDAVRPRPARPIDREAAAQLAELGVTGTLVYTDPACALHALSLPSLTPAQLPGGIDVGCEISVSPDGRHVAGGGARWNPDGSQYAICRGTRVDVVDAAGGPARAIFTGCAPAFRSDGMLTFARDGRIRQARLERVLVPRSQVERAAMNHPNAPGFTDPVTLRRIPPRIEELVVRDLFWLSQREVAALVDVRFVDGLPEISTLIAGFVRGTLAWQKPYFGRFERLVVSSGGDVLPEPAPQPFPFVTSRLQPSGRQFDWSPDGRLLAIGTRASIFVVEVASQRLVRIPATARDVAWR
jgi:hypothetical protein